jgi:hypothetical protein
MLFPKISERFSVFIEQKGFKFPKNSFAMPAAFSVLREWAVNYMKHRDIIAKKIAEIKESEYGFVIRNSDATATACLIQPSLKDLNQITTAAATIFLFTLNNSDNLSSIGSNWEKLAAIKNLTLVVVNPVSKSEQKWLVKPYVHNQLFGKPSLEALKGMAALVEQTDEQTLAA